MPAHNFDEEYFFNRDREQEIFKKLLRTDGQFKNLRVLCCHGAGGVGKSWLRSQFAILLPTLAQGTRPIPWAEVEYNIDEGAQNYPDALKTIARGLENKEHGGYKCKTFNPVYAFYLREAHHDSTQVKELYKPSDWGEKIVAAIKFLYPILFAMSGVSASLTVWLGASRLKLFAAALPLALAGLLFCYVQWTQKRNQRKYAQYEKLSAAELRSQLLDALADDLESIALQGPYPWRAVIFFDALEPPRDKTPDQHWIAHLAGRSPRTLCVLMQHYPLDRRNYPASDQPGQSWHGDEPYAKSYNETPPKQWQAASGLDQLRLMQLRLCDLNRDSAIALLTKRGITDKRLQEVILSECREERAVEQSAADAASTALPLQVIEEYHAYSLEMCVSTLRLLRGDDLSQPWHEASKFALNPIRDSNPREAILIRYIKALRDSGNAGEEEVYAMCRLAFTPQFDLDAAAHAFHSNAFTPARLNTLRTRNYISKLSSAAESADGADWFVLSYNLRHHFQVSILEGSSDYLETAVSSLNTADIHQYWRSYWLERNGETGSNLKKKRSKNEAQNNRHSLFAQLAWYHRWHIEPKEAWEEWQQLAAEASANPAITSDLLRWWDKTDIRHRKPQNEFEALIASELAAKYWKRYCERDSDNLLAYLIRSIEYYERAADFFEEARDSANWAIVQFGQGLAHGKIGELFSITEGERWQHLNRSLVCYEAALPIFQDKHSEDLVGIQYSKGRAHSQIGRLANVLSLDEDVQRQHFQDALACYEATLSVWTQDTEPEGWAQTQFETGNTHGEIGKLTNALGLNENIRWQHCQDALACYEAALSVWTQDINPADWSNTQSNKGNVHEEIGRLANVLGLDVNIQGQHFQDALTCYIAALSVQTQDTNPADWSNTQFNKAITEWRMEDWAAALNSVSLAVKGYRATNNHAMLEKAQQACNDIQDRKSLE